MKVEIEVGQTIHRQDVKVIARRDGPTGPWLFDVVKEPVGQRDDRVVLSSLPAGVLEAIGKAASTVKGIRE